LCMGSRGRRNHRDRDAKRIPFARRHRAHTRKSRKKQARSVPTAAGKPSSEIDRPALEPRSFARDDVRKDSGLNLGTVSSTASEGGIRDHPMGDPARNSSKHCASLMRERARQFGFDKTTSWARGPSDAIWRQVGLRAAASLESWAAPGWDSAFCPCAVSARRPRRLRDSRAPPARRRACEAPWRA
jgi:hypothetical protein